MKIIFKFIFFLFCLNFSISSEAQSLEDSINVLDKKSEKSVSKIDEKNPRTAGLLSIVPGLGQIYNEKYWKVPIVYAALGASACMFCYYNGKYAYYRDEYRLRLNGVTEGLNPELANVSDENLHSYERYYQRNQELGIFVFIICYGINVLDAIVDAHFSTFDVSDNLRVSVQPFAFEKKNNMARTDTGLGLSLVFKLK